MFHSMQLAWVQLCFSPGWKAAPFRPAQQWFAGLLCYSVTAAAHTRCPCQRLDMAAGVLFFLNCNTCVYTCLLQVECDHLQHSVEG